MPRFVVRPAGGPREPKGTVLTAVVRGRCFLLPVLNAVSKTKCLSSRKGTGRFFAAIVTEKVGEFPRGTVNRQQPR